MTPCNFLMAGADFPGVIICDVRVVEAMYTTKNKYFDKHSMIKNVCFQLLGESILFSETTQEWKTSRKVLSPSFYKGKLVKMVDLAKVSMRRTLESFKRLASAGPRTTIDLVSETSMMQVRILLMCALGQDFSDHDVDFWLNGKLGKVSLAVSLRECFHGLINRFGHPHCQFFGEWYARHFVLPYERDLKKNCLILRDFIS